MKTNLFGVSRATKMIYKVERSVCYRIVIGCSSEFYPGTKEQKSQVQIETPVGKQYPCDNRFFHRAATGNLFKNFFTYLIVHVARKQCTVAVKATHSFLQQRNETIHSKYGENFSG